MKRREVLKSLAALPLVPVLAPRGFGLSIDVNEELYEDDDGFIEHMERQNREWSEALAAEEDRLTVGVWSKVT